MGKSDARPNLGTYPWDKNRRRPIQEDDRESSGVRKSPPKRVSLRRAALTFTDQARDWTLHQLVSWTDRCLIRPGRLITRNRFPRIFFNEPELGMISYGMPDMSAVLSSFLPHARANEMVRVAHRKVINGLDGMLQFTPDDRFARAALYDGCVTRVAGRDGGRRWDVLLTEEHSLSQQVLALFAADLLENRFDYENNLVICSKCQTVDFWPERLSRRSCPKHPDAVLVSRIGLGTGS